MSEKDITMIRIENLVFRLNSIALQRKELNDKLWALEDEGERLRLELIRLITAARYIKGK